MTKMLGLREAAEQLQTDGVSPSGGSPEQFRDTIRAEIALWRKVAADAGVKVD